LALGLSCSEQIHQLHCLHSNLETIFLEHYPGEEGKTQAPKGNCHSNAYAPFRAS
jgi:hypothetical protein